VLKPGAGAVGERGLQRGAEGFDQRRDRQAGQIDLVARAIPGVTWCVS
jgi:hypothetical protein